jgi:hypothetical protein
MGSALESSVDLALHRPRLPITLEKWYIDVLLDDGGVLLVYLGAISAGRLRLARVTADLFRPGAQILHGDAKARHVAGAGDHLSFGPAVIDGDSLSFATGGLSGALSYRPRFPPCQLRHPFLQDGTRALTWDVEIPDADVEGEVRWPGGRLPVRGRGYRDRVFFDLPPWRFPIHGLVWGRAVSGQHAATWVRATTARATIAAAWKDGHALDGGAPPAGVVLGDPSVLLDADVARLPGLRLGPLRGLLGRMTGAPHETKWRAACTIDGEPGVAVHEWVAWRHGRA